MCADSEPSERGVGDRLLSGESQDPVHNLQHRCATAAARVASRLAHCTRLGSSYAAALWRAPSMEAGGAGEEKPSMSVGVRSKPAAVDMDELARFPAVSHERVQR